MFSRVIEYFYSSFCRIYRVCNVQNEIISESYYFSPKKLWERVEAYNTLLLHRTLLWDDCEPLNEMRDICLVRKYTSETVHVLWNAKQIEILVEKIRIFILL